MWLERIPIAISRACLTMLPRLQAEELLAASHAASMGSGHMNPQTYGEAIGRLQRLISGVRRQPVHKPTRAEMAAIGIAYREASS